LIAEEIDGDIQSEQSRPARVSPLQRNLDVGRDKEWGKILQRNFAPQKEVVPRNQAHFVLNGR
jgi:hypothetical protein